MTPYYEQDGLTLWQGDVLATLAQLPADSVDCVMTSPPYWSLRKYSGEGSVWGGDPEHEHEWTVARREGEGYTGTARWQHSENGRGEDQPPEKRLRDPITRETRPDAWSTNIAEHAFCACGAWRGQYGLEPAPELYVEHTLTVLRAIRRVLKPTGTVWWNIGDGYAGSWGNYGGSARTAGKQREIFSGSHVPNAAYAGLEDWRPPNSSVAGLKPKDLICMPWRVGLAAQADGWWLRSDIIWSKPNPMPESVTDRPTKSHEYVLLLAKSERYYFDADAVREPLGTAPNAQSRGPKDTPDRGPREGGNGGLHAMALRMREGDVGGRNIRSVWNIPTQPSPLPHFASFPEALAERCIKAGAPDTCSACGRPYYERRRLQERFARRWNRPLHQGERTAGIVLDPFAGTGTTLKVARDNGRQAIGIEISAEYCELATQRLNYGIKGVQAIAAGQSTMQEA